MIVTPRLIKMSKINKVYWLERDIALTKNIIRMIEEKK